VKPIDSATVELGSLVKLFFEDPSQLGTFEPVDAPQIPSPSLELLAHNHHMTVTLERHHRCPVVVQVLDYATEANCYSRKSLLTRQADDKVVQYGIVRLRLNALAKNVRQEIESREIPLGRVLVNHNVLREVKLLGLFRIACGAELAREFGCEIGDRCFGRTAVIYCDGAPAVELLEIVSV
jgi:chorismate-pyruvate lyase